MDSKRWLTPFHCILRWNFPLPGCRDILTHTILGEKRAVQNELREMLGREKECSLTVRASCLSLPGAQNSNPQPPPACLEAFWEYRLLLMGRKRASLLFFSAGANAKGHQSSVTVNCTREAGAGLQLLPKALTVFADSEEQPGGHGQEPSPGCLRGAAPGPSTEPGLSCGGSGRAFVLWQCQPTIPVVRRRGED